MTLSDEHVHHGRLLIDGELLGSELTFDSFNPATGALVGKAADASAEHAVQAIEAARRAFDESDWSRDTELRVACMRQLHDALRRNRDEFAALTTAECGHTQNLIPGPAFDGPVELLTYNADFATAFEFSEDLGTVAANGALHRRWLEREPIGVVAAIIAYNYPMQLALAKVAPAMAAGCTVVLKGAPQTPLITALLAHVIATETDIPSGVINVLTSSTPMVGEVLVSHPAVDMVSFTGSTIVGRKIMASASDTVKRVFLELGGKSAIVVLDDADIESAATVAAMTICSHAGQGCAITSRLLVPDELHDHVLERVVSVLDNISIGDPADPSVHMGPLISDWQREKVDGFVQRALSAGARLAVGGYTIDGPGHFYAPTVLTDVDAGSELAQEELFGPVLATIRFTNDADAIRIANDSIFGLSGAVYSRDVERAVSVARRIRTGAIGVNGGMWYGPDVPFGGYRQSGIGREYGLEGFNEFLETKALAVLVDR